MEELKDFEKRLHAEKWIKPVLFKIRFKELEGTKTKQYNQEFTHLQPAQIIHPFQTQPLA